MGSPKRVTRVRGGGGGRVFSTKNTMLKCVRLTSTSIQNHKMVTSLKLEFCHERSRDGGIAYQKGGPCGRFYEKKRERERVAKVAKALQPTTTTGANILAPPGLPTRIPPGFEDIPTPQSPQWFSDDANYAVLREKYKELADQVFRSQLLDVDLNYHIEAVTEIKTHWELRAMSGLHLEPEFISKGWSWSLRQGLAMEMMQNPSRESPFIACHGMTAETYVHNQLQLRNSRVSSRWRSVRSTQQHNQHGTNPPAGTKLGGTNPTAGLRRTVNGPTVIHSF